MSECVLNFVHFKNRMLNLKSCFLLKELIYVFLGIAHVSYERDFLEKILKKESCKICGA